MSIKYRIVLVFVISTIVPFIIVGTLTYLDFQKLARAAGYPSVELGYQLLFFVALLLLFVAIIGSLMSEGIVRPIIKLSAAASRLRQGDLSARAPIYGNDEIGQLATDFNAMAKELERVDQTKSELTAMISHQLRTPSTAIQGLASTLLDYHSKGLNPKQKKLIELTYDESDKLQSLITQIAALIQVDSGDLKLEKSHVDLASLAKKSITSLERQLEMHRQKVVLKSPREPVIILGNPDTLSILLDNLLVNASKYSPDNTKITVGIQPDGEYGSIRIKDRGFGIDKEDQGKIFSLFSRVANANTAKVSGSGVGLYLVKKIVERHEGEITVDSKPGQGTAFTVKLPLDKTARF